MTSCISQRLFSFYRHRPIRADFSGGQISSDAGLLPLRAFDQRHGLTGGLAERVCDPREEERIRAIALTPGLISGASATKPNTARPVPTCVSWSPTCQAAAVRSFPSITIAGNVRTALKSLKMALLRTA